MITERFQELSRKLDLRRRKLGMTYEVLAKRSGVSMPTIVRTLTAKNPQVSFENFLAIAEALGTAVRMEAEDIDQLLEQQASKKARHLVGMAQGSSGLEAQAVGSRDLDHMTRQTIHELLAGSRRRLWGD
jgi:transcriptional regulator with XRE-family HTH domain